MQTEVPTLPIVSSDSQKNVLKLVKTRAPIKNSTQCTKLNSLLGGPYKDTMRVHRVSECVRPSCKNVCGERIISAKMLRMKELQNQLSDAHYHLNELASENRLLKALQKRQDSALKQYEGPNAELPKIIHSHQEELKVLQVKYKQLKAQHRHTCEMLNQKENELYSLRNKNKHLLQLSKDQHLVEREKLQMQVSDLNHQIDQQHETIQLLNRKLTVEGKKLRHQLNSEVNKHKTTRKQLQESLEKLKTLEELLNNREKRYYNNSTGPLPGFRRTIPRTSQSLTNLQNGLDNSTSIKASNKTNETNNGFNYKSFPKLVAFKAESSRNADQLEDNKSETMANLQQVRKFRLPKSARSERRPDVVDSQSQTSVNEDKRRKDSIVSTDNEKPDNSSSDESESEKYDNTSRTSKSKMLYARLVSASLSSLSPEKLELPEEKVEETDLTAEDENNVEKLDVTCEEKLKIDEKVEPAEENEDLSWIALEKAIKSDDPSEDDVVINGTNSPSVNDDLLDYFDIHRPPNEKPADDLLHSEDNNPINHVNNVVEQPKKPEDTTFSKEKLLAAIKAIDDNENIEFMPHKVVKNRSQVTENLYRGLPTHVQKRDDIIKDIFGSAKGTNKLRSGCSKLH